MPMLRSYGLLRVRSCAAERDRRRASGASNPAIIISVVVLPDPLGPRKVTNSPRAMSIEMSSTAFDLPSYDLTMLRRLR